MEQRGGDRDGMDHVSEIELVNMNLGGDIASLSELVGLRHLRHLALYNNDLSGSIPDSVVSLTRLGGSTATSCMHTYILANTVTPFSLYQFFCVIHH